MYDLSSNLVGHNQDVKCVIAISDTEVVTGSRDGTVQIWNRDETKGNVWNNGMIIHRDIKYVNCVCFDEEDHLVYYGGQNMLIKAVSPLVDMDQEATYCLAGHNGNVCGLSSGNGWVISSSWDKTAKVWYKGDLKFDLRGHTAAIWHAIILPGENRFLTASADKTIKLWEGSKVLKTYESVHNDVVRYVTVSPSGDSFLSCSNDGTIKHCDFDGKVLKTFEGHESFVYCVKFLGSDRLVSCGEDRSVRIWSLNGEILQVIRVPAVSIWSLDVLSNGDIAVASSDNLVRIFTADAVRLASSEEIEKLKNDVTSMAISSQTMEFDESKLSPPEVLNAPGKKEGQVVVVKNAAGVIEAHQFSCGQWSKIGDVVSSSSNSQKQEYEGKMYDYVFDIDVQEGSPVLKLPVNANDNPYDVADKFIARYELPTSYKEQIVEFILKNTETVGFDQTTASETSSSRSRKVLPVKIYLKINSFNPDSLFTGITKLNATEGKLDDDNLAALATGLHDLDNNYELLYSKAVSIRSTWTTKTPAFDIMRLIVHKLPSADSISKFVDAGFDSKDPILTMLTTRMLVNAFENPIWGSELMSSKAMYESVFELLDSEVPKMKPQHQNSYAVAVATLIYNYTVLALKEHNLDIVTVLANELNNKYGPSSLLQNSEEASYRLLVAYGNLSTLEPSLSQFASSITWLKHIRTKYSHLIKFQDIFEDI
ncbi:HFL298Cp [Eremothecium sinecaudum]|uniref:HFL298Cp n=1 Tax=Eremothecium sinecaudum TaxID=45286 RepID=A0A109V097_9SACH|nr:HFL298Cp [Eremothecium sinecaudum]AMD21558.1 HFL298Cp [Eremothecium sinecaudum]